MGKVAAGNDALVFGRCAKPVRCGLGLTIGGGQVFPEVNYTLPPMRVAPETFPEVREEFRKMVSAIIGRSGELRVPGLVLEFEQPFDLTMNPEWGATVTADTKEALVSFNGKTGIPCALRVTVADIRDKTRPPRMRTGTELESMMEAFRLCARAGGDILSIESTGGKEITDEALTEGDLRGVLFGLLVLGCADMGFLWERIVGVARESGTVPGADSACGFGNTAMRLADMNYVPRVLAAVIRAASAARSLVAFEKGAAGPSKDCAYEGAYLKALLGVPIAMEGRSAACAHFSHIGNVAQAFCDLWSNESVQNVRLLSGFAPEVFAEILAYDCRLMNGALARGKDSAMRLRDLLVDSDANLDPQAYVLATGPVLAVAGALADHKDGYSRGLAAARVAADMIAGAAGRGELALPDRESVWLDRIREELEGLPATEKEFIENCLPEYRDRFLPAEYGLA